MASSFHLEHLVRIGHTYTHSAAEVPHAVEISGKAAGVTGLAEHPNRVAGVGFVLAVHAITVGAHRVAFHARAQGGCLTVHANAVIGLAADAGDARTLSLAFDAGVGAP